MDIETRQIAWRMLMDAVSKEIGEPIHGFALVAVLDNGQTVLYGADFSHDPKIRAHLTAKCKHFIREIAQLEKRGGNVTSLQGRQREQ